jgi:hypothetical protein
MRIADALNILGLVGVADSDSCETAYRRAAMKFHPDRSGGSVEMMQAVNQAIEAIRKWYTEGGDDLRDHDKPSGYGDLLAAAIAAVVELEGIAIEICGSWVWITGDTRPHKAAFREAGYMWGAKKAAWYFRPAGFKSRGRGKWTLDEIRDYHGSQSVPSRAPTNRVRGTA